jgi:hypothetical protein
MVGASETPNLLLKSFSPLVSYRLASSCDPELSVSAFSLVALLAAWFVANPADLVLNIGPLISVQVVKEYGHKELRTGIFPAHCYKNKVIQVLFLPKKSRSDGPTSHLLKRTHPAVRPSLNNSVMQYFFNTKNKMHFDPVVAQCDNMYYTRILLGISMNTTVRDRSAQSTADKSPGTGSLVRSAHQTAGGKHCSYTIWCLPK